MAKVKGLEKSLKDKAKKEAYDLRFGNLKDTFSSTAKEKKKFLENNPNVKTATEMKKMIADKKSASESQSRMNLRGGGCAQIKGFGKARRPKKKYS